MCHYWAALAGSERMKRLRKKEGEEEREMESGTEKVLYQRSFVQNAHAHTPAPGKDTMVRNFKSVTKKRARNDTTLRIKNCFINVLI